jgi:hypothetical protein
VAPEPVDALILVTTAVPMVSRLVEELRSRHGLRVGLLDMRHSPANTALLNRLGLRHWHWAAFLREDEAKGSVSWIRAGLGLGRRVPRVESPGGLAGPGSEVRGQFLQEQLRLALCHDWPLLSLRRLAAARALDALQPRCVVSLNLYHFHVVAGLVNLANERGIPTLCVQHGVFGGASHEPWTVLDYQHLMLWGEFAHEAFRDRLSPHTQVSVTGHCLHDEVSAGLAPEPAAGAGAGRRVVLVAPQSNERLAQRSGRWWVGGVCEAARRLGADVWVKLHPIDWRLRAWEAALRPWPGVRLIPHGQAPLMDLIRRSDVLVTIYSTVALEAAMCGKPAITVNLSGHDDFYPFAAEGGAVGVHRYEDIAPALEGVLHPDQGANQASLARFLHRHLGPLDGQATRRIGDLIAAYGTAEGPPQ